METIAQAKAMKGRLAATSRQSANTPFVVRATRPGGSTRAWATVSTAKIPAAVRAAARKSARSRTLPRRGPTRAPVVAKTLKSANASALRSPAS